MTALICTSLERCRIMTIVNTLANLRLSARRSTDTRGRLVRCFVQVFIAGFLLAPVSFAYLKRRK